MENYSFSKFNSTIVKSYESECLLYEKLWRIQLAFRFDLYENTKNLDSRYKLYKSRKSQLLKEGHSEMDASYLSCQLLSNYNYLVYDNQIIQNDLNFLSNVLYKHYERVVLFLGFCYFEHCFSDALNPDIFNNIKEFLIDDIYETSLKNMTYDKSESELIKVYKIRTPKCLKNFLKICQTEPEQDIVNLTYNYEDKIGFCPIIFPTLNNDSCAYIDFICEYY